MSLTESHTQIARPLKVLVPLIRQDLEKGDEAARQAGMAYYRAAGEKMLEAKGQLAHGEFKPWIEHTFKLSIRQAQRYMSYVDTTTDIEKRRARHRGENSESPPSYQSMRDFERSHGTSTGTGKTTWHEPVKQAIAKVDFEAMRQEQLRVREERDLERELALELINIGYKALATKLHPDKGGSRMAMSRLNKVRDRLKQNI